MNGYDNSKNNDYRAPWLQLDKQQMQDPFGWMQSKEVDVMAILKQMNLDDRIIDCLLRNYCPDESKAQAFANYRQNIGRKAIQIFKKQQWDNELKNESKTKKNTKKNVVKINESTLRQIIIESVEKVLEDNSSYYDGMFAENEPAFGQYANFERKTIEAIKNAYYSLQNVSARLDFEQKFPENVANVETAKELQKIMVPCLKAFDEYINS